LLEITENITIDSNVNVIWAFITDFSLSLHYNRFHTDIELSSNYSISKMNKFNIKHNFGFGNYQMVAEITECIPPNKICISEYCENDKSKGFPHNIEYYIKPHLNKTKIFYTVKGTYGGKVQDMSFKPILKGVMIEELVKIKIAIESSEKTQKPIVQKSVKPI